MVYIQESFPSNVLDLPTRDVNRWMRQNNLSPEKAEELRIQRRRRKNRGYSQTKRRKDDAAKQYKVSKSLDNAVKRLVQMVRDGKVLSQADLDTLGVSSGC